ncbi:MAG: phosphoribosyltransferase, partial [Hymenobacteraceae bacterium]|nr:phosphoribosyltransferase [Hymenobacteraceae bacterium]MDX5397720.1 phosphoribosyltransferase [Hymenobacteraceae bacterium]MDX5444127.1 phosphoribosyltransferase [Hymenobacteraceae bacterium]MDX5513798.1 phosphoribosyltransferase [Hymenobacteraceae bacterium]
ETPLEQPVQLQPEQINVSGKVIILVDDVLNTGKTLAYSLIPFLQASPKKIETATLIDRHHTLYPVSVTYTGYSLSTTLQEHVKVVLDGETEAGAYLV